jgi:hypothetical protein
MKPEESAPSIRTFSLQCAACAGFGAAFAGALLALDIGGLGALVARADEPFLVLLVLVAGMLSLLPLAFLTGFGAAADD